MLLRCLEHWLMFYWPELSVPSELSVHSAHWLVLCFRDVCVCLFSIPPPHFISKLTLLECKHTDVLLHLCFTSTHIIMSSVNVLLWYWWERSTLCCEPQKAAFQETKLFVVVLGKSSVKSFPQVPEGKRFVERDNTYLIHTCSCLVDQCN